MCFGAEIGNGCHFVKVKQVALTLSAKMQNFGIKQSGCDERTPNMGFSAMLAEEYILIVPFAYQL